MNWPNLQLFSRCSLTCQLFTYTKLLEHTVYTYVYSSTFFFLSLCLSSTIFLTRNVPSSSEFYQKIAAIF